jgi:hypothetical protein
MRDGFAGKSLATYEHRNTVQMYSYSPAPNSPGTHGASVRAVENSKHCEQNSHWPVTAVVLQLHGVWTELARTRELSRLRVKPMNMSLSSIVGNTM